VWWPKPACRSVHRHRLLVVIGTAWLMELVGVSMALGAFLAGLLLADSEYRHELEAQIEPFKGLLLGLFFISVGMGANLSLLLSSPLMVLGLTLLLIGLKLPLLYASVAGWWPQSRKRPAPGHGTGGRR
jgi:glutathione-regulated potassium-efflux system protein KefB